MKYLFSSLSGLAGAIIFTVMYNFYYAQSLGVVRIDELLGTHISAQGMMQMSQEEQQNSSENFARALDAAVKDVSEEYKVVLLVGPAVVSSTPDYTDIIKERISERLDKK